MNKNTLFTVMAALTVLGACTKETDYSGKEQSQPEVRRQAVEITIPITLTKTTYSGGGIASTFESGDRVYIELSGTYNAAPYSYVGVLDYASASSFSGTVYGTGDYGDATQLIRNCSDLSATLLPNGYSTDYLAVSVDGEDHPTGLTVNPAKAFADGAKDVTVPKVAHFTYSVSDAAGVEKTINFSVQNAVLFYTLEGLGDAANVTIKVYDASTAVTGTATVSSGTATFAVGYPGGAGSKNYTLSVNNVQKLTLGGKSLAANKVYNVSRNLAKSFGNLFLSPGILVKTGSTFSLTTAEAALDIMAAYGGTAPVSGASEGTRYYFSFLELAKFFNNNADYTVSDGDITNVVKVNDGVNDWGIPTKTELETIYYKGSYPRTGATVNGISGRLYAKVRISLSGSAYEGHGLNSVNNTATGGNYIVGLILFPDYATLTISPSKLTSIDTEDWGFNNLDEESECLTFSEYESLLDAGCVFLPAAGVYTSSGWSVGGAEGHYHTAKVVYANKSYCYYFQVTDSNVNDGSYHTSKTAYLYPVRLVRPIQ